MALKLVDNFPYRPVGTLEALTEVGKVVVASIAGLRRASGRAALAVGAVAASVLLSACGASSGGTGQHRPEEKVLHIYNWADYIGKDTIAKFEAQTGIKVIYDTYDSDDTLEAKMMAGDSGYDVVSTSIDYFNRQIKAGIYRPLDKSLLPNWNNLDPQILALEARGDPGNRYAMPYLRYLNGFAYNVDMIRARMPDAPVGSLDMLFKPEIIRRFADCGVTFFDSPEDVLQLALNYLHIDPNTTRPEDYKRAEQLLLTVRPYVKTFDSSEYMNGLATGEFCISMSWSGDYAASQARARVSGVAVNLRFTVPKEGANGNLDALLIPADAPHPIAAHKFLNFILEPQVMAEITNYIHYANDNRAATRYVDPDILRDPAVYPTPEVMARLYYSYEVSPALERLRNRTWTHIKTDF